MSRYVLTVDIPDRLPGGVRVEPLQRLRQWVKIGARAMGVTCASVRDAASGADVGVDHRNAPALQPCGQAGNGGHEGGGAPTGPGWGQTGAAGKRRQAYTPTRLPKPTLLTDEAT